LQFSLLISQSILVGYLSQYFCTKRTLEDELTLLRNMSSANNSITSKQEEIDDATRDAYLYAVGMILIAICLTFAHGWGFHTALNTGMQLRIATIGAIYHKVCALRIFYIIVVLYIVK